jgi:tRNA 2-thiouridine synthesizing protein A
VNNFVNWDDEIDARGLLCPLPVLRARKRLMAMEAGRVLRVLADDPAARIDMPHFCAEQGHDLLRSETAGGGATAFLIRKAAARCGGDQR